MTVTITIAHNEARLGGTLTFLQTGSDVAHIKIYSGTRPAAVTTAPSGGNILLVDIPLDNPPGVVTPGSNQLVLASAALPLITNSGTASWARVVTANGATAFDCDVTDVNGTGEIKLPSTTLFAGGKTQLVSGILS